jgi:hypothetical protein
MRSLRFAFAIGLLAAVLWPLPARAVPTPYGVRYDLTAVVTGIYHGLLVPCACEPVVTWGDEVSVSLHQYAGSLDGTGLSHAELFVTLPNGTMVHGSDPSFNLVNDGPGDGFHMSMPGLDLSGFVSLGMDYQLTVSVGDLLLSDPLGVAWSSPINARDPELLPDYPPDLALFLDRGFSFAYRVESPGLPTDNVQVTFRITSLVAPEPGVLPLSLLAAALLVLRRPSAD